jgi:hypothetical protein
MSEFERELREIRHTLTAEWCVIASSQILLVRLGGG